MGGGRTSSSYRGRGDGGWSESGPRYPRASHTIRRTNGDEGDGDGRLRDPAVASSNRQSPPTRSSPYETPFHRLHHRKKNCRHMIQRSAGRGSAITWVPVCYFKRLVPRDTARGCGQVQWFSHQKGGNRSENGFTGLIGAFGNRRPNSPRVTGMAAGRGGNCRSSRGRNSAKTLMMAFVRSLRSDPMDHAIAPRCVRYL